MLTKKHEFIREKDCCIIAGNGPSLETIDYTRLPREYDVFRCNQFYFEDKYFLGKKIKAYFANPFMMPYQYCTVKELVETNQYEIENIFCITYGFIECPEYLEDFKLFFPDVFSGNDVLIKNVDIASKLAFRFLRKHKLVTAGVYMCVVAALLGYKELYLSGIDFYKGDKRYAFTHRKEGILNIIPNMGEPGAWHSEEHDLEILRQLESYGVKIYAMGGGGKTVFPHCACA